MSKHTPGPWVIVRDTDNKRAITMIHAQPKDPKAYGQGIAKLVRQGLETDEPNALLIAAAPEMLEALKELVAGIETRTAGPDDMEKARAAIAKATGGDK